MNRIDRIVYINLDRRPDRRTQIEGELERIGVLERAQRFSARTHTVGAVGCSMSHAEVVLKAATDGVGSLLVLEDDFFFKVSKEVLNERIAQFLDTTPDYDVVMLDYFLQRGEHHDELTGRVLEASCAAGYLVAGRYLPTLAQCLLEGAALFQTNPTIHWIFTNDQYWKRLQSTDRWYYFLERLGYQRDGYSDLGEKHVVQTYGSP